MGRGGLLGAFRAFRRSRPFWSGVFAILGGAEIMVFPLTPIASLVNLGIAGISSVLTGIVLVILGLFIWFSPPNRTLAGVLAILLSLASFLTSNLGGLIVGMVLGLIGGGLALAWTPEAKPKRYRVKGTKGKRGRKGGGSDDPPPPPPLSVPEVDPNADTGEIQGHPSWYQPSQDPGRPPHAPLRRLGVIGVIVVSVSGLLPGAALAQDCGLISALCAPSPSSSAAPSPAPRTPAPSTAPAQQRSAPAASSPAPVTTTPAPAGPLGLPNLLPPLPTQLGSALPKLPLPKLTLPPLPLPTSVLPGLLPSGLLPPGLLPSALGAALPALGTPPSPNAGGNFEPIVSGRTGKLTMDTLSVTNFRYAGTVVHRTATGGSVKAMRILIDSTDIGNLGVVMPGPKSSLLVNQAKGAPHASTPFLILDATKLKLTLFGVLPVEFSMAFPPPPLVTIPNLSATNVDIDFVALHSDLIGPKMLITVGPPSNGAGAGVAPTNKKTNDATLVSLAKLLNLPALLAPYGLNAAQAQRAMAGEQPGATPAPTAPPPAGLVAPAAPVSSAPSTPAPVSRAAAPTTTATPPP